jgi:hypothetical protein
MECDPTLKAEVERNATPPLRLAIPSEAVPSKNCTVPVAVEGETVAVNFTVCPETDGLTLEESEVDVPALFTVCVKTGEVLPEKPAPPA